MSRFVPNTKTDTDHMKDGWSQSGKLTSENPNQPVTMQANFPFSGVYTVQFSVASPPSGVYRAVALVAWTVEGNTITRLIDIGNGVSISAPAQAVRVIVNDMTTTALGGTAGETYGVTVSATRGVRAVTGLPLTLRATSPSGDIQAFTIAPGATATFTIPQDAGVLGVEVTASVDVAATIADLIIAQVNTAGATRFKLYKYVDPGSGVGFVSITPLATSIQVTNIGPDPTVVSLTWAIEG
jgi:hypothetical protein